MRIFVDETGWVQLLDRDAPYHRQFVEIFTQALNAGDKFFTHNIAVGMALSTIKRKHGPITAGKFHETLEEAHTGAYLSILWIGRRTQKEAVRMMRKGTIVDLDVYDYAACLLMRRRRIQSIMTKKRDYHHLEFKVVPELGEQ